MRRDGSVKVDDPDGLTITIIIIAAILLTWKLSITEWRLWERVGEEKKREGIRRLAIRLSTGKRGTHDGHDVTIGFLNSDGLGFEFRVPQDGRVLCR